jgi:hypothetical protein
MLSTTLTIFAQNMEGSYRNGNDLLKFEGNRLLFDMEEVGGYPIKQEMEHTDK